jgi:GTP pyrophosphokinase
MIESLFNSEVATMVNLLTKNKSINYHNDKEEMQNYLDRMFPNEGACLIKTADRIHNFSSMRESTSPEHKMKQVRNTKEFFIPFFKRCRNEYAEYSHFFFHAKTIIEPIMFEIEENNRLRSKVKILEDFNKNKID